MRKVNWEYAASKVGYWFMVSAVLGFLFFWAARLAARWAF